MKKSSTTLSRWMAAGSSSSLSRRTSTDSASPWTITDVVPNETDFRLEIPEDSASVGIGTMKGNDASAFIRSQETKEESIVQDKVEQAGLDDEIAVETSINREIMVLNNNETSSKICDAKMNIVPEKVNIFDESVDLTFEEFEVVITKVSEANHVNGISEEIDKSLPEKMMKPSQEKESSHYFIFHFLGGPHPFVSFCWNR